MSRVFRVVIPISGKEKHLDLVFNYLKKSLYYETFIVMVLEPGAELSALKGIESNWSIIKNETRLGYCLNVNKACENFTEEHLCVLNSDCLVAANWQESYLANFNSKGSSLVSFPSNSARYFSFPKDIPIKFSGRMFDRLQLFSRLFPIKRVKVCYYNGYFFCLDRSTFNQLERPFLDESLPEGLGVEYPVSLKLKELKIPVYILLSSYCFHFKSESVVSIGNIKSLRSKSEKQLKQIYGEAKINGLRKKVRRNFVLKLFNEYIKLALAFYKQAKDENN